MLVNIVRKSDFAAACSLSRLDPEFVNPVLMADERALASHEGGSISTSVHDPVASVFKPTTLSAHNRYLSIDSVDLVDGLCFETLLRREDLPSRAKYLTEPEDVLVSNVRPNRGAIALIDER